jgi:hypothetical protein
MTANLGTLMQIYASLYPIYGRDRQLLGTYRLGLSLLFPIWNEQHALKPLFGFTQPPKYLASSRSTDVAKKCSV